MADTESIIVIVIIATDHLVLLLENVILSLSHHFRTMWIVRIIFSQALGDQFGTDDAMRCIHSSPTFL